MPSIERWRKTWRGLDADSDDLLYETVIVRYADPRRSYHTVQHLDECFDKLDESRTLAAHAHEVELALWFHDAVYDVRGQDNEEQSAAWADSAARGAGLPAEVARRVRDLIMGG